MKKILKISALVLLILAVLIVGAGVYMYSTNPIIKAVVDNDESKLFYFPVKSLDGLADMRYEEIPLVVDDSVTVYAYSFEPETDSIRAVIFFIHGSGGNVGRYTQRMKPLVAGGFRVYALDWRGFGKSEGRPLHENVLADTKVAFKTMLDGVKSDSTKIVVFGQSLGGQVAVRLTKEFEEHVDALVLDGSIASFPSLAEDFAPVEFLRQRARNNPDEFNQPYKAMDDIAEIDNTPKLIIQSKDDKIVRPIRGRTLFENAREPKVYWQTEGEHIQTLVNYPEETVQKVKDLIE